jgi:hypothetical protein
VEKAETLTLPKFQLSGFGTITILLIGWPIIAMYPPIRSEKATGLAAVAGALAEAVFTPQFWVSAILLLLFFWYTSQISSKIFRTVPFWIPTVFATVIGGAVFAVASYAYLHRAR